MIAQLQFNGVGMQVILAAEIRLSVFAGIVIDQCHWYNQRDIPAVV